jgi:hypothetical protein
VQRSNSSVYPPPVTSFKDRPIGTLATLARILHVSPAELAQLSTGADRLYRIGKRERKNDGTIRLCYDALPPLKSVQARIQCLILNQVEYPPYLQGSIKDRTSPRGQAANARLHVGQRTLISEDIKQFFPSVRRPVVFDIWHRFFGFPPMIADCLTKLTTKDGALPQGTKTSALLANLVFWEHEYLVATDLHEHGMIYSRLTDDITCSSELALPPETITYCITALRTMCQRKGLQLKRQKQTITHAWKRMVATKLVVNTKTSLPAEQRSAIRAAVEALTATPPVNRTGKAYARQYGRTAGQVSYLKQHHPAEAEQLRTRLRKARPGD